MIETIGGGIKKMFLKQKQRFFPLPDYDLTQLDRIVVKIQGKILNDNYTRLLIEDTAMDLAIAILLDKVQKQIKLSKDEHSLLKSKKLIEGRYPNLFVVSRIASVTGEKAKYIKYRGFDKDHYQNLIIMFIEKYGSATREEIDDLLFEKLPDILTKEQKATKINNMLSEMTGKLTTIKNIGSKKKSRWVLSDKKIIKNNKK